MEQRPLEYTVKIYCEDFTEWYYFEWLRTNKIAKIHDDIANIQNFVMRKSQ